MDIGNDVANYHVFFEELNLIDESNKQRLRCCSFMIKWIKELLFPSPIPAKNQPFGGRNPYPSRTWRKVMK